MSIPTGDESRYEIDMQVSLHVECGENVIRLDEGVAAKKPLKRVPRRQGQGDQYPQDQGEADCAGSFEGWGAYPSRNDPLS